MESPSAEEPDTETDQAALEALMDQVAARLLAESREVSMRVRAHMRHVGPWLFGSHGSSEPGAGQQSADQE